MRNLSCLRWRLELTASSDKYGATDDDGPGRHDEIPNVPFAGDNFMFAPKPLTRRQVLQTASVLGISALSLSQLPDAAGAEGAGPDFAPQSGLITKQMKALKYEEIPGLLT